LRIFVFFLLTYANLSQALGIGDIALKSHLGEPLVARINVTDVEGSPDAGCFFATDASDVPAFKKANLTLKQNSSGYQLNITTHDVITEPIVILHVSFQCEPNFKREYVLLLDPVSLLSNTALGTSDQPAATNSIGNNNNVRPLKHQALLDENVDSKSNAAPLGTPVKEKRANKKKFKQNKLKQDASAKSAIDKKLVSPYTGKQQTTLANSTASVAKNGVSEIKSDAKQTGSPASASKPYLTISSGNLSSNEHVTQPSLSLRLETQMNFDRAEASSPLANSDAMDEITVMANRLTHLEKQIINLQNINTQLLSEAEQAKNAGFQLSALQSQWLQNILIAIGILGALAGAEWLRRKAIRDRLNKEQAIWFGAEKDADTLSKTTTFSANATNHAKDAIFDDPSFDQSAYHHLSNQNPSEAYSFADEAGDSGDNILESADVFIEHGRPSLAIQLLQNHLSDFPTESPKTWLKLLNLLATEGSATEYDNAVAECKHFFNIKMPSFVKATTPDESSIEDFPHIVSRLEDVWGSQFAVGFLSDLIYNQYAQPREGFERGTFEELFLLKQIAEILSANISKKQDDFYQPTGVKSAVDNLAFNDTSLGSNKFSNDTKVSEVVKSPDQVLTTEESESALFSSKNIYDMKNSPFQTVPSYEVDMLLDFDETLEMKKGMAADASKPESYTATHTTNQTLQFDEISFSFPTDNLPESIPQLEIDLATENASQDKKPKSKKSKETNVIEWDLPKLD